MAPDNVVVVPNSKMAKSVVTNYSQPDKKMSVSVVVRVDYASDPDRIEGILIEEAKSAVGEVPGLLGEPEPMVRLCRASGTTASSLPLYARWSHSVTNCLFSMN